MLTSIFALAARRDPGFAQYQPGTPGRTPDIYLVDADSPEAFNEFRSLHKRTSLPAVLIGSSAHGTPFKALPRPLQWAKLLQALEDVLANGEEAPVSLARTNPEPAQALRRSLPGTTMSRSNSPQAVPDAAAQKRMLGDTV